MVDIDALIDYYVNLLIIQYNNKPKARATIEALAKELLANGIYFEVRDGYDIETAVGIQLDVLGKYQDIDRFYSGSEFENTFSFIIYDEVDAPPADRVGFANYTDFETKVGNWLNYEKFLSNDLVLNDDDFRTIIKLRIIQNNSDHSHESIDQSVFNFFASVIVPDSNGHMVMDYFVEDNDLPIVQAAVEKEVLPRPMGVKLRYFIDKNDPYFGFATYQNDNPVGITGFANYSDYDTKEGETLRYLKLQEA